MILWSTVCGATTALQHGTTTINTQTFVPLQEVGENSIDLSNCFASRNPSWLACWFSSCPANRLTYPAAILDFPTPRGLSLTISRLPSPQFKSTYTMNALPSLNGTFGYLFTSRPLDVGTSATVQLKDVVERFRIVSPELVSDSVEEGDLSRKKKGTFVCVCGRRSICRENILIHIFDRLPHIWSDGCSWWSTWGTPFSTALAINAIYYYRY